MSVIRLVRHGRAAAGWDADPDPDLDDEGRRQAAAVADALPSATAIVTSPLLRCRSTAAAFAAVSGLEPVVDARVAEIPSPTDVSFDDRLAWLRDAMDGTWADLGRRFVAYRDDVVDAVLGMADGTVVFSHFVAINAVIGACCSDDRLVVRRLDHCSVTTVEISGGGLRLVDGGDEADTIVR